MSLLLDVNPPSQISVNFDLVNSVPLPVLLRLPVTEMKTLMKMCNSTSFRVPCQHTCMHARMHAHTFQAPRWLIHSAGMSVWRQALVCAPGMRNLTSRLEFEPLHSSSRFSEIGCPGCASSFPTECLNNYIKSSPTTRGCVWSSFKWRPHSWDWRGALSSADFCKRTVKNCVYFCEFSVHGLQKEIDCFL